MTEHAIDRGRARGDTAQRSPSGPHWRGLAWRQYRLERKMFWRNPSAAFFNFLLPLLFLGFFGAILSGNQDQLEILVPGIAGMAVMSTTFNALAFNITALRETGILKRVRGTPLPTSAYLAGHLRQRGHQHRASRSGSSPSPGTCCSGSTGRRTGCRWRCSWSSASSASARSASRSRTRSRTSTRRRPTSTPRSCR